MPADELNADDSPNLMKLLPPISEPRHGKLNKRDYRKLFPVRVVDGIPSMEKAPLAPEKVLESEKSKGRATAIDDDLSEIEDITDFDFIVPKLPVFGFPQEFGFDENSLPETDCLDMFPDRPGAELEMGFPMPQILDIVPGEPRPQDQIIDQGDDHIRLEVEIEFPKIIPSATEYKPGMPGTEKANPLPELPTFDVPDPVHMIYKGPEIVTPEPLPEMLIPKWPLTIYHSVKNTLGKAPKPLKPKPFQKVLNTIPMPMRIKNVPFKPVGEPRGRQVG